MTNLGFTVANEKFENSMRRKEQACPPIWMMRQAGRYHSHYQNLRKKHSFMELCKVPELAAEVAMGPIRDFDFDIAILFSDILFPLEAMGMGLEYGDSGPKLGWHCDSKTITKLLPMEEAFPKLEFQRQALLATREILPKNKSLIGFIGGPFTLFTYAVAGSHQGSLVPVKQNLNLFPKFFEILLPLLEKNIQLQLEGGAEVVMIFDTAAGELAIEEYHSLVVPILDKLITKFPKRLGYYAKGIVPDHLEHPLFKKEVYAGLGVDHRWNMAKAFAISSSGFVQGNFDQTLLTVDHIQFKKYLQKYLENMKKISSQCRSAWVAGLGHGVIPQAKEENVAYYVRRVREFFYE